MKKLSTNLNKKEISSGKGSSKWYKVLENEVRVLISENQVCNNKKVNEIQWKTNKGTLCKDSLEYAEEFYEKNKELNLRVFIKSDTGVLYSEYDVDSWGLGEGGIEINFK